jgi:hypothetical protein
VPGVQPFASPHTMVSVPGMPVPIGMGMGMGMGVGMGVPGVGLEKWFGSAILAHDQLPPMPKARSMSVQEIETQLAGAGHHKHNT